MWIHPVGSQALLAPEKFQTPSFASSWTPIFNFAKSCQIPANLRMTITSHRPPEAKPLPPDGFVSASYIESFGFQLISTSERPNLSTSVSEVSGGVKSGITPCRYNGQRHGPGPWAKGGAGPGRQGKRTSNQGPFQQLSGYKLKRFQT